MLRFLIFFFLFVPTLAGATSPEILECTVAFTMKENSEVKVEVVPGSDKNLKIVDSGKAPNNVWMFLIRFLGPSVSDFSSVVKFQTVERFPAEFKLSAQSGRHFGDVKLFNLLFETADSGEWLFRSAKAELVAQPSPRELNAYASLQGDLALNVAEVSSYAINCGTPGWSFGGTSKTFFSK